MPPKAKKLVYEVEGGSGPLTLEDFAHNPKTGALKCKVKDSVPGIYILTHASGEKLGIPKRYLDNAEIDEETPLRKGTRPGTRNILFPSVNSDVDRDLTDES